MAAPLPRRLAAAFANGYRLKLFEPPYTSPPFDIMALWHRDHGEDRYSGEQQHNDFRLMHDQL